MQWCARLCSLFICLAWTVSAHIYHPLIVHQAPHHTSGFNWSHIKPSSDVEYHNCFEKFQCARLLVPLDWPAHEDSESTESIPISIIKLPARVPQSNHAYRGPVVVNPGGPGGSGVDFVLAMGEFLRSIVDSESVHYDILSFDPRGVGLSGPVTSCFEDALDRAVWNLQTTTSRLSSGHLASFREPWARARAYGKFCAQKRVGEYVSAASVARDMLHIVQSEHKLSRREYRTASSTLDAHEKDGQTPFNGAAYTIDDKAMLRYIGFSYGTFLGATFASMFPDHVDKMLLDGPLDALGYISHNDSTVVQDTDKALQAFYQYCFDIGKSCPLYDASGPHAIAEAVSNLLEAAEQASLVAVDDSGELPPEIITTRDIKFWIFVSLYSPTNTFPTLASLLAQLLAGETSKIHKLLSLQKSISCSPTSNSSRTNLNQQPEAPKILICVDSNDITNQKIEQFQTHVNDIELKSQYSATVVTDLALTCTGWVQRPKWRFTGPYGARLPQSPILWMGNSIDPVTPIQNAYAMAKLFPGSVVLEQETVGHCALFNHPSNCTIESVRRYFASGELPREDKKCPAGLTLHNLPNRSSEEEYDMARKLLTHRIITGG